MKFYPPQKKTIFLFALEDRWIIPLIVIIVSISTQCKYPKKGKMLNQLVGGL